MRSEIQIPDHFFTFLTICGIGDILGDLLALSYGHRPIFTTLGEMTAADKAMNS